VSEAFGNFDGLLDLVLTVEKVGSVVLIFYQESLKTSFIL
jgi:hypothetical protein